MKNRFWKRIAAMAMILAMIAMLAGCSCNKTPAAEDGSGSEKAQQAEDTSEDSELPAKSTEKDAEKEQDAETDAAPEEESEEEAGPEEEDPRSQVLENYEDLFVVTTNLLNVRKEPTTSAPVIATIAKNGVGEVLGDTDGGAWLKISSGGVEGYVASEYVATGKDAEKLAVENCSEGVRITKEVVNVRAIPDSHGDILTRANLDDVFQNLGLDGEFYHVTVNGKDGYVHTSCAEPTYYLEEAVASAYTAPDQQGGLADGENSGQQPDNPSGSEAAEVPTTVPPTTAPGGNPASYSGGSNGIVVCIDAGHQAHGISAQEPNGPGSSVMKAKLTTGTQGCATGIPEYEINLQVSLKLQAELQARGYTVVMIRTTNDCPLSNAERAQVANNAGAHIFVRIHCNSSTNQGITGVINYAPSPANPYLSQAVISGSNNLAALLAAHSCAVTGAVNRGVLQDDTMTGINWCQMPVAIVEMGFMSNPTEDQLLANPDYQYKQAVGMANGIDAYFGR